MLIISLLIGVLCAAAWYDVRYFRIPNFITISGAIVGIALNTLLPSGVGFVSASSGFAFALIGLLPLFFLRVWGAGDVKLMAVVGAFVGAQELPGSLLASLLAGGVTSLFAAAQGKNLGLLYENMQRMFGQILFNLQLRTVEAIDAPPKSAGKVPYALPILFGTVGYLFYRHM